MNSTPYRPAPNIPDPPPEVRWKDFLLPAVAFGMFGMTAMMVAGAVDGPPWGRLVMLLGVFVVMAAMRWARDYGHAQGRVDEYRRLMEASEPRVRVEEQRPTNVA